jgi:hypothetical protein
MDWERLGKIFTSWSMAVDGKHAVYVEDRRGEWYVYFSVSRSKGLMLANQTVQERLSGDDLTGSDDPAAIGARLAAKMAAAFE